MAVIQFLYGKTRTGDFHPKGGGFVESTAAVDGSVYVGPMCKVIDVAQVKDTCELHGQVIVADQAIVELGSLINDHSVIRHNAHVISSEVHGYSVIKDDTEVSGIVMRDNSVIRRNYESLSTDQELKYYDSQPCDTGCDVEGRQL